MANRFDFENMLMQCWSVTDDIKTVTNFVSNLNIPANEHDKLLNMLVGIETLYHERFIQLMDMFSTMVRDEVVTNKHF